MRHTVPAACVAVAIFAAMSAARADDEAQKLVDSVFGESIRRVAATPSPDDDVKLAADMFSATTQAGTNDAVRALILNHAAELGAKDPAGYDTAIAAMRGLAKLEPERRVDLAERASALRQKQFRAAKGDDRAAAGEAWLDAMLDEAAAKSDDPDAELTTLRRAVATASAIKSPRADAIRAAIDAAAARRKVTGRIDDLKKKLQVNPQDHAAGVELIRLIVAAMDDAAEARKYTFITDDAELNRRVQLATADAATLDAAQALDLADWYRSLSETEMADRIAMLRRSHGLYSRYLQLQPAENADRMRATLLVKTIEPQLADAPDASGGRGVGPVVAGAAEVASWEAPDTGKRLRLIAKSGATPAKVDGRDALSGGSTLTFDVDNAFASDLPFDAGDRYFVRVLFYTPKRDTLYVVYNRHEDPRAFPAEVVNGLPQPYGILYPEQDVGRWCERVIELTRPLLNGKLSDGGDLIIRPNAGNALPSIARVTLERLKLRPVADRTVAAGTWVDAIALVDPKFDASDGVWVKKGRAIAVENAGRSKLTLPVVPHGDYQVEMKFTRVDGTHGVALYLPVGSSACVMLIDHGEQSGLHLIDGAYAHQPGNPTGVRGRLVTNGQSNTLIATVKTDGEKATITGELNGKKIIDWTGRQSQLRGFPFPQPGAVGLTAALSAVRFDSIRIRATTGTAELLH